MALIDYALDGPIKDNDDETRIVYHVCGCGSVLVIGTAPGWGTGMNYLPTSFKPMVGSGKVTLVGIQPRGTLPSERPKDELRMSSKHMAGDIDALRRHLGHSTINVLGHSNGAAIALAYAELFPSHCSKAILIETQVIGFKGTGIMPELEKRKDDPRYAEAVALCKAGMGKDFVTDQERTEFLKSIFGLYFFDPETGVPEFLMNTGPLCIQIWAYDKQATVDVLPEAKLVDDLGKVTADVLLISGQEDFICKVDSSKFAQEAIGAKAKHIIYPECGHMPWIEQKEDFFRDLMAFVLQ